MAQGTLWRALQGIEDHRTKRGRRFPLPAIIAISLCAMLSGANDLMAIFRFGRQSAGPAGEILDRIASGNGAAMGRPDGHALDRR
jgi:hypothetical protein